MVFLLFSINEFVMCHSPQAEFHPGYLEGHLLSGRDLAPSLGGMGKIFADLNDVFSGINFHFHAENF